MPGQGHTARQLGLSPGRWRVVAVGAPQPLRARSAQAAALGDADVAEMGVLGTFLRRDAGLAGEAPTRVRRPIGVGALPVVRVGSEWSSLEPRPLRPCALPSRPDDAELSLEVTAPDGVVLVPIKAWFKGRHDPAGERSVEDAMPYWRIGGRDRPLLIPIPELLRAVFMPTSNCAEALFDPNRARCTGATAGTSRVRGVVDGRRIVLATSRWLGREEALMHAAMTAFYEPRECFAQLARGCAGDGCWWSDSLWPLPPGTELDGVVLDRDLSTADGVVGAQVLASVDQVKWPLSMDEIVVEHARRRTGATGGRGAAPRVDAYFLQPGRTADPGLGSVVASRPGRASPFVGPPVRHIGLEPHSDRPARGAECSPDAPAVTTGAATAAGRLPRVRFGPPSDGIGDLPLDSRMEVTLAALRLLAGQRVVAEPRLDGGRRNVWVVPSIRTHLRRTCWAEPAGRLRNLLVVDLGFSHPRSMVLDCAVVPGDALALSVVELSVDGRFGEGGLAAIAVAVARRHGLLIANDPDCPPDEAAFHSVRRMTHPPGSVNGSRRSPLQCDACSGEPVTRSSPA